MKLLLVGKSATGKDTVADILVSKHGYKRAESYTTRPKRTPEEKGHHYISSSENFNKIAPVVINGYEYFLTKQEIKHSDVIIVEPTGIQPVCEACPDEAFYLLYITADKDVRRELYKKRNPDAGDEEFDRRENEENERFAELEAFINDDDAVWQIPNIAAVTAMENKYDEDSLKALVEFGHTIVTRHNNLRNIIRQLASKNALRTDDEENILVQEKDGNSSVLPVSEDIFTAICLSSDENKMSLFDLWLTLNTERMHND